jgi:sugar lactone lactonase YvrE
MADDLEFGPEGQLAWTSILTGIVHARDAEGAPTRVLVEGMPGANSIAYSPDGRLFFAQVFQGDALWEIDPRGDRPPRLVLDQPGGFNGFDFGPDGYLYGPLWFRGSVVKINPDSGALSVVADGFHTPAAANFDSKGNLWVVDTARGEVLRVDTKSGEKSIVARVKTGIDNLAFDANDRLFISNFANNGIYEIATDSGESRTVIESPLSVAGGLALVESGGRETLFIADTFAFRKIDPNNGSTADVARMFAADNVLEYPDNVSASPDSLLLTGWFSGTVQRRHLDGGSAALLHGFAGPTAALELPDGRLLVAEMGSSSLVVASGEHGEHRETLLSGLALPIDLEWAAENSVYLVEATAGTISRVDLETKQKSLLVENLLQPESLAILPDRRLVVAEVGRRRLVAIDTATGAQEVLAEELPIGMRGPENMTATYFPTGLAVSKRGHILQLRRRHCRLPRAAGIGRLVASSGRAHGDSSANRQDLCTAPSGVGAAAGGRRTHPIAASNSDGAGPVVSRSRP